MVSPEERLEARKYPENRFPVMKQRLRWKLGIGFVLQLLKVSSCINRGRPLSPMM